MELEKSQMIAAAKYHSYGNDFIAVALDEVDPEHYSTLAKAICHAHMGVGACGCVFTGRRTQGDFEFRIFNQDGSEAAMSGNGSRCACAYLHHKGLAEEPEIRLQTPSGPKIFTLLEEREAWWKYRCRMGLPQFEAGTIPFQAASPGEQIEDYPLEVDGRTVTVTALSVGNPQCVIFVEEFPGTPEFQILGSALEIHPRFPERTNVCWVQVEDTHRMRIKLWERGVGPTHSSGTGCCAAAVAAIRKGIVKSPVEVRPDIGSQLVEWEPGSEMIQTGESEFVADIKFHWCHD